MLIEMLGFNSHPFRTTLVTLDRTMHPLILDSISMYEEGGDLMLFRQSTNILGFVLPLPRRRTITGFVNDMDRCSAFRLVRDGCSSAGF